LEALLLSFVRRCDAQNLYVAQSLDLQKCFERLICQARERTESQKDITGDCFGWAAKFSWLPQSLDLHIR
jgi:hypothetical protein